VVAVIGLSWLLYYLFFGKGNYDPGKNSYDENITFSAFFFLL